MKEKNSIRIDEDDLFKRVVAILEQARANVARSVNTNMVVAYWLIGREIVEEIQGGEQRAEYGKQVIEELSGRLNKHYGSGFSVTNLQDFRRFYVAYPERIEIQRPTGVESSGTNNIPIIQHPSGVKFATNKKLHLVGGELVDEKGHPVGDELENKVISSPSGRDFQNMFNPNLSWSHYRALMRVKNCESRNFYEKESAECGWSKTQLERQIHSSYYERIINNQGEEGLVASDRERLEGDCLAPVHVLKSPMVLEFLDIPDNPKLHESIIEQAIIDNLQAFLLELGKGFSFVARQKHIRFDNDDFYVDLVFYNYILKCFMLIDLKIGKLTHRDVGQMDGYVRLFEDQFKVDGDNPTVGLILCSDKSEAVARYSVLNENKQLFAAKYLDFLPSEEQLKIELEKERKLIEENL